MVEGGTKGQANKDKDAPSIHGLLWRLVSGTNGKWETTTQPRVDECWNLYYVEEISQFYPGMKIVDKRCGKMRVSYNTPDKECQMRQKIDLEGEMAFTKAKLVVTRNILD